jgi:hypothetical protein
MPAQTTDVGVVYYSENDTAPELPAILRDGAGKPIDLTGATVTISIAYSRYSYYYSPTKRIVDRSPCEVDPDQVGNKGVVRWTPGEGELSPPGEYQYYFKVTYPSGGVQTIPPNTYLPMIIRTPVGGQEGNIGGP